MQANILLATLVLCLGWHTAQAISFGCLTNTDCTKNYTATMLGLSVVPPSTSTGNGETDFSFHRVALQNTVCTYIVTVANVPGITSVELHQAPKSQNGDLVAYLYGPNTAGTPPSTGTVTAGTLTGDELMGPQSGNGINSLQDQMDDSNIYVFIKTSQYPNGAVRGQFSPNS